MKSLDLALPATRKVLVLAIANALTVLTNVAFAQPLEEIVVTAERRELRLQDTPISIMAFSGEKLEALGVSDLFDVGALIPNLDIKGSRGSGDTSPTFQIRGIGTGAGATGERSVGFYLDNVFMPRTTGPVMRVLDVERIEILRGPQGTLFGRNSTGGAIRVFSKQANAEKDAYVRVTGGNFEHQDISGMFNVPLNDELFLRVQAATLKQEGYVSRGPQMLGSNDDSIQRVQLGWHPSSDFTVNFGLMHTDSNSDGSPTDMTQFNMNPVCPTNPANPYFCLEGNYADWVSDFLAGDGKERLRNNDARLIRDDYSMPDWCFLDDANPDWNDQCLQWNKAKYTQYDMNISWEISETISMLATTGVSDFSSSGVSDWQLLGMEFRPSSVESDSLYQEVQFNFALGEGLIDLIVGANYFQEDSGSPREALYQVIGSSVFNATTGGSAFGNLWGCAGSGTTPPLCSTTQRRLRVTGDGSNFQDASATGLFVNSSIHFNEQLNLTLGVRQSWDEKAITSTVYASDNFIPQTGGSTTVTASDKWNKADWRATLDYHISDAVMFYLTSSKAFRSGTFSIPASVAPAGTRTYTQRPQPAAVPPESLLNNEVGIRSDWFDGRFRVNATYYRMDFTNRQGASAVADATSTTGFTIQLVNQGDVQLWGTEIEAMLAATDKLTFEASAGFADYEMANVCINNGPFMFPPPMDSSFSLSGTYDFEATGGTYVATVSGIHTGPMQTHPGGFTPEEKTRYGCTDFSATFIDSRYEVPSYNLVNLNLRFTPDAGKWTGSAYINNLTDVAYANNAQSFGRGYWTQGGPSGGAGLSAPARSAVADFRGRPREFGLTVQYNFF